MRRASLALLVGLNAGASLYVGFLCYVLATLPLDDSVGARMTAGEWRAGAAVRLGGSVVAAVALGLALLALNRLAGRDGRLLDRRLAGRLAAGAGLLALLGGAAGALQFLVTRPWF